MSTFRNIVDTFADGEAVTASVLNRPILQLIDNDRYLKERLDIALSAQAVYLRDVEVESIAQIGQPVYWDDSDSRFELAVADGTVKQDVVGVIESKSGSTVADIVIVGLTTASLTAALNGVARASQRYWLSTTLAGIITATRPTPSIQVGTSFGSYFLVMPQYADLPGPTGATGDTGATGATGPAGPAGNPNMSSTQDVVSGTTTDSYVSISDTGNAASNLSRVSGILSIVNTGGNVLAVQVTVTDNQAVTATDSFTVAVSESDHRSFDDTVAGLRPPFRRVQMFVKSNSTGLTTTYSASRFLWFSPP